MTTYECLMPHCRQETYRHRDVCEDCWEDRRVQLAAIPELYVMTYALLTPGSRIDEITNIQLNKPESGVPFSLVAYDALEHAHGLLCNWADWAMARAGIAGEPLLRLGFSHGRRLAVAVDTLLHWDFKFAITEFAGDYVLDVWYVYRRLIVQTQPTEPRHLNVRCPVCDNSTVLTRHADEYAACLTCSTEWPHSQLPIMHKKVA